MAKKMSPSPGKIRRIPLAVLMIFSIVFIIVGIVTAVYTYTTVRACSASVLGSIYAYEEDMRQTEDDISKLFYAPVVRYEAEGQTYIRTAHTWTNTRTMNIDQEITIRYNPNDPDQFFIPGYDLTVSPFFGILFILVGIVFFIIGWKFFIPSGKHLSVKKN